MVAALLDYVARVGVALVVTPLIVSTLGRSMYGVWEMLSRLVGYVTAADGRPTQGLRLIIAHHQSSSDRAQKRRFVGAAAVIWVVFLPLLIGAGVAVVALAPTITKASADTVAVVQLAAALLVLALIFQGLTSLPEAVLRGSNLGYRRMGLQASLAVVGGVLMALVLSWGWGLAGLAGVQVVVGFITGVTFWWVVRKYVPWFGLAKPDRPAVKTLFGISAWVAVGDGVAKLLLASDVIILGFLTSPELVAVYVLTAYPARIAVSLHGLTVQAAIPGLAGVMGSGDNARARILRSEMLVMTALLVAAGGATILLWNRPFLSLWVGGENFAGFWPNVLVVVLALQTAFIRSDAYVIDSALRPRTRVMVSAGAAVLAIGLMVALTPSLGIVGTCLGLFIGRGVQSVAYPLAVRSLLGRTRSEEDKGLYRTLLAGIVLLLAAAMAGRDTPDVGWLAWVGGVTVTGGAALAFMVVAGLPRRGRISVLHRVRNMLPRSLWP
jgi:O-antigen/teichoic acid export membrane protein